MLKYIYPILLTIVLLSACQNEEKIIPPPEIFLKMPVDGFEFDTDSAELIEPIITYDIKSTYKWLEGSTEINDGKKDYLFENNPLGTYKYTFEVETPSGSDKMDITVHSLEINTFEEFKDFNDNGYFNSPEAGFHHFPPVHYPCEYDAATPSAWNGFAISKNASKTDSDSKGEFSVYGSSAADESKNFTIFKQVDGKTNYISFDEDESHVVKSIAVNNCTRTYLYMNTHFDKKGGLDYFKLTINGLDASGTKISGPVEVLLADYRPEQTAQKFLLSEWKVVELKELGSVNKLEFKLTSSHDINPESELPMYFCMDNLKISE
ncbi:MAG: DUF4465 domain-containing protein [Carboxylicivirga sp.]|jgi:hypothetical protein|nr:DUF4465 domain-containing protein [Carboxylicivirga sp.]